MSTLTDAHNISDTKDLENTNKSNIGGLNGFNDVFNLNYLGQSNISLNKALLLFYLIIASNFTKDLYSGQLYNFINENRFAKHIIGFIIMLVIMINVAGITDVYRSVLYSAFAYLWFTFTTKLDLIWNFIIIALLLFGLIYESKLDDKEIQSNNDEALDDLDKKKIKDNNDKTKLWIAISILLITITGTGFYLYKKGNQFGGEFDMVDYIFKRSKRFN